jgi:hypothetical protein
MRTAAAATALGLTLIAAAGLAACAPEDPVHPPDPGPSRTPVFASEEEALAAAEELYGEYLAAENLLGAGGWNDISLVEPFLKGEALDDEIETAEGLSAKGYRQVGEIVFDSTTMQQLEDREEGALELTLYLCLDVSNASILDSADQTVVIAERPNRIGLEIAMDDFDGDLRVERSEPWAGSDFC